MRGKSNDSICVNGTVYFSEALSPAFLDTPDYASTKYSTWAESTYVPFVLWFKWLSSISESFSYLLGLYGALTATFTNTTCSLSFVLMSDFRLLLKNWFVACSKTVTL